MKLPDLLKHFDLTLSDVNIQKVPAAYRMLPNKVALWKGWSLNIVILVLALGFLIFTYSSEFVGHRQGFFCDDRSLQFKFQNDTVTFIPLLTVSIGLPLMVIICTEGFNKHAFDLLSGFLFISVIVESIKLTTGELRPHFWDSCKPNISTAMCSGGYVTEYQCTNDPKKIWLQEPFASFPSGHASISAFGMMFFIMYLQRRLASDTVPFLALPALQTLCVIWMMFCSITRVTDHRHHSWDVIAGDLFGVTTGIIASMYRSRSLLLLSNDQHHESSDNNTQPPSSPEVDSRR